MVKKIIGLVCIVVGLSLTIGCSKREQIMAGTSVVSASMAGASFLKGHFKRNDKRKRKMTCLKYHRIKMLK